MVKQKIDVELISVVMLEIMDRVKLVMKLFPEDKEQEPLLRNLAGMSIHAAFFMRDIVDGVHDRKITVDNEQQFYDECGCKDHV